MSIVLHPFTVEVFKFRSTGVVALCEEVVDYVKSEQAVEDGILPNFATFREDPVQGTISVVFHRRKE